MNDSKNSLFRTPVDIDWTQKRMSVGEDVVMLGSCFAQHMATRMQAGGIPAVSNPMGVLYNPASITLVVEKALRGEKAQIPLVQTSDGWQCWWAGTQIAADSEEECRELVWDQLQNLSNALRQARWLFVTLGTNVCYKLHTPNLGHRPQETVHGVVANCLKQPSALFDEISLNAQECTDILDSMMLSLQEINPSLCVIFTVSPYRYAKYGFHKSQLAKSALLIAIDSIVQRHGDTSLYFPAYEIVNDELRDYRFYAPDMLHPSEEAADYIWKMLRETAMDPQLQGYVEKHHKIAKMLAHQPSARGKMAHQKLMEEATSQKQMLQKLWDAVGKNQNRTTALQQALD